jgi:hypothetical protein
MKENLPLPLTNSVDLTPILNNPFDMDTDTPINVGIDNVRVGTVLKPPYFRDKEDWLPTKDGGKKASWPITEDACLTAYVNSYRGVTRGYITFNPSRIIDPNGTTCASWDESLVAIGGCAQIAYRELFIFEPTLYDLDMYTLHLTADFAPIPDMQRVMKKTMQLEPFRRVKPRPFLSAGGKAIESVYFETKTQGQIKFYDKSVKANLSVPTLRIEWEIPRKFFMANGLPKVGDITDDVIQNLFETKLGPVIKALKPTEEKLVDEILANPKETKTLLHICGREFLARLNIHPKIEEQFKRNKREFDKKYFYVDIEDIL